MPKKNSSSSIAAALRRQYTLRVQKIKLFRSGVMNLNLLLLTDSGRMVLRVYRRRSFGETRFEQQMLHQLAADGFPCPKPLHTSDGRDAVLLAGRPAILYRYIDGTPAKHATPAILWQVGRLQGQIHAKFLGRRSPAPKAAWEPRDIRRLLDQWRPRLLRSSFPGARQTLDFLERELGRCRFPRTLPRGWTHQDIKPENTLVKNGRVVGLLDFDNCYAGALLHDLTTTIIWWCFPRARLDHRLLAALLRGYESERRLRPAERRLLLLDGLRFRLLREMLIGPITTLDRLPLATRRFRRFRRIFRNTFGR